MSVNQRNIFLALCLSPLVLGCGNQQTVRWTGEVTVDGAPVESGSIRFEPAGGEGQTAGAGIERGQYSVELAPGTYNVEVRGYRLVGQEALYAGSDEMSPVAEELGHLRETVEVTSSEVRDFALEKP